MCVHTGCGISVRANSSTLSSLLPDALLSILTKNAYRICDPRCSTELRVALLCPRAILMHFIDCESNDLLFTESSSDTKKIYIIVVVKYSKHRKTCSEKCMIRKIK